MSFLLILITGIVEIVQLLVIDIFLCMLIWFIFSIVLTTVFSLIERKKDFLINTIASIKDRPCGVCHPNSIAGV